MTKGAPAVCNRAVSVRLFYICKYRKAGLPSPSRLRRATARVAAPSIRFVLKKHLRLAGHCPNNDSLFPPLAAVIIVAPKGRGKSFPEGQRLSLWESWTRSGLRGQGCFPIKSSIPRFLPVENSLRLCYDRKQQKPKRNIKRGRYHHA